MADQRTMAELLRAPTEGYVEAIMVPPILAEHFELKHSLINMMTSDQFFRLEKDNSHDHIRWFNKITFTIKYKDVPNSAIKLMLFPFSLIGEARRWLGKEPSPAILTWEDIVSKFINEFFPPQERQISEMKFLTFNNGLMNRFMRHGIADQDSLSSAAGGNLLKRGTQDVLTIIENKSKVCNSRNKSIISQVKSSDANSSSSSEIAKLTHAVNQQTSDVTTAMIAILKQFQATPPPASVKSIKEICVTCDGAHPYYQCLPAMATLFWNFRIIFKDTFQQPHQPQRYNRGNNFNQDQSYQAPMQQNQVVPLSELEKIKKMNEINIIAMQTQINNVKNELRNEMKTSIQASLSDQTNEFKNMMASFFQMNTVSTSGSRPLPSNTIANPKSELKSITTRSGLVLDGPSIHMPPPFINPEEDERVEETLTDLELALLSNKEKLLELANTPLNENCSAVILKKLPEKLGYPGKFLIPCGFSELKCKALADLANRATCTSAGIARDVFVSVGKFTFPANFVIVNYESDPRVLFILGRPFLRTARALIDVHREEMILHDDLFATNHLSGNPTFSSHTDLTSPEVKDDIFDLEGDIVLIEKLLNLDSTKDLPLPHNINPLSGSTTSSSPDYLLEEFFDELSLITFPPVNNDLSFDIESDLRETEYLLNHDPTKEMDSILEDSINKSNLAEPNDNLFDTIPEMFTDEHSLDYSSLPLYDEYDDDLDEFESDIVDVYNDPFDSNGEKIKESKLLIDELDLPRSSYFLPSPGYDSFLFEDFSRTPDKNVKKIAISHASLILEDFDPPLYELPFYKEVPWLETLLLFSSKNEEKVFKPGILTSKGVHSSFLSELSHWGHKVFKLIKFFESPMEIFLCSFGEDIRILDVPCLHFYPP
nr:reverse transcriptase domain-containing protein [Tanacetum cinerariifolium]